MREVIDTPEKLKIAIQKDDISEKDKVPSYVSKAYYDEVILLKEHYRFTLSRILESINEGLNLSGERKIAYQALRSALRRIEAKRGKPSAPEVKATETKFAEIRANENTHNSEKPQAAENSEKALPEAWEEILNRHPTIKAISLHKAIDSGLPIEKAQSASQEGTKQLLEILNKYRSKAFR